MAHQQREHAKWSGSNAHRWMICYGQPNLLASAPDLQRRSTRAADDGTLAHEILEHCLVHHARVSAHPDIDRSVGMVLDHVEELRAAVPDIRLEYEKCFAFPQTVVPRQDCAGILDIVGYSPSLAAGWLIDFKHGVIPVEAEENSQLWFGAASAFWDVPVDVITLTIVQPNGFVGKPIKSQEIHAADLPAFVDEVSTALAIALQPGAPLVPGEHCRMCPAEPVCLAREEWALREIIDAPEARHLPLDAEAYGKAVDLGPDRIAAIMNAAPALRSWLKAVEDYAHEQAMGGAFFPGWKLIDTRAARKWAGEPAKVAEELIALSNFQLTLDDVMPRKLANITEMEPWLSEIVGSQAPKGEKRKAIESFNHDFAFLAPRAATGNYKMVPASDKHPAAKPGATAFAHVQIEAPETTGDET